MKMIFKSALIISAIALFGMSSTRNIPFKDALSSGACDVIVDNAGNANETVKSPMGRTASFTADTDYGEQRHSTDIAMGCNKTDVAKFYSEQGSTVEKPESLEDTATDSTAVQGISLAIFAPTFHI